MMKIRELKKTDINQLLAIEHSIQVTPWSANVFEMCLQAGYQSWVMEQDKLLLGFVIVSINLDECHILNLGVTRKHQRQGLGRGLLNYALSEAAKRGAMLAYLEVRETNDRARKLYENMAFSSIGRRKDYYPTVNGREDALVLVKDLSQAKMTAPAKLDRLTAKVL